MKTELAQLADEKKTLLVKHDKEIGQLHQTHQRQLDNDKKETGGNFCKALTRLEVNKLQEELKKKQQEVTALQQQLKTQAEEIRKHEETIKQKQFDDKTLRKQLDEVTKQAALHMKQREEADKAKREEITKLQNDIQQMKEQPKVMEPPKLVEEVSSTKDIER